MGRFKRMAPASGDEPRPNRSNNPSQNGQDRILRAVPDLPADDATADPFDPATTELIADDLGQLGENGVQLELELADLPNPVPTEAIESVSPLTQREVVQKLRTWAVMDVGEKARKAAIAPVAQTRFTNLEFHRQVFAANARFLQWHFDQKGHTETIAYQRHNVDRYVSIALRHLTPGSRRTIRSLLHRVGKVQFPEQYPAEPIDPAMTGQVPCKPPATAVQVREAYTRADSMTQATSMPLTVAIDLITCTGARSGELLDLTPEDIGQIEASGRQQTIVRLTNKYGVTRNVPFTDPVKGRRVARFARARQREGHQLLLPGTGKNRLNKLFEAASRRGFDLGVDPVNLRHAWITQVARVLPAEAVVRLGDLGTSRAINDLLPYIKPADVFDVIQIIDDSQEWS